MNERLLTLAFDFQELISAAVVIIIIFGSTIGGVIKEYLKKRNQSRESSGDGGAAELDERLAQRRRQRTSRPGGVAREGEREPENLSMADRIARARAKQQYQQRQGGQGDAATPGQQRHGPTTHPQAGAHTEEQLRMQKQAELARRQKQQAELERRRMQQRKMLEQQQQVELKRQRSAEEFARQQQLERTRQKQARMAAARKRAQQKLEQQQQEQRRGKTHAAGSAGEKSLMDFAGMDMGELRRAIVLKEILDKPVGLREPDESALL